MRVAPRFNDTAAVELYFVVELFELDRLVKGDLHARASYRRRGPLTLTPGVGLRLNSIDGTEFPLFLAGTFRALRLPQPETTQRTGCGHAVHVSTGFHASRRTSVLLSCRSLPATRLIGDTDGEFEMDGAAHRPASADGAGRRSHGYGRPAVRTRRIRPCRSGPWEHACVHVHACVNIRGRVSLCCYVPCSSVTV